MAGARDPIVLITGAAGNLGSTLSAALADGYRVSASTAARARATSP